MRRACLLIGLFLWCVLYQGDGERAKAASAATTATVAPSIRLIGKMAPLFGILTNANHGWLTERCGFRAGHSAPTSCGQHRAFRAWADGPMNPYRHGGNTYFQVPHSENYRIKIPNNFWGDPRTWTMEGDTLPSARRAEERFYDNRHWIFSVRNINGVLYSLTHHEWYKDRIAIGNVQGFLAEGRPWVASIGWAKSVDGGLTWKMKPIADGSRRLVIVPQPSDQVSAGYTWYGFAHPSNIVWDARSQNFYAFVSSIYYQSTTNKAGGVALLRSRSLDQPTGWEFWNGSGWTPINHNTYQGNFGQQTPYLFWRKPGDCSHLYATNVRRHKHSGKWIVLGHEWCTSNRSCWEAKFFWTSDISNPIDLERESNKVTMPSGTCVTGRPYYSFFDVDGTADDNYQEVGNRPLLVSVAGGGDDAISQAEAQGRYYHQFLELSGF